MHKGLFRYNRLPFGITSTPGIFQGVMEGLLSDIPGVLVYLDDILITGSTDTDHLKSNFITFGKGWTKVAETEV